jgi:hypothetical protein
MAGGGLKLLSKIVRKRGGLRWSENGLKVRGRPAFWLGQEKRVGRCRAGCFCNHWAWCGGCGGYLVGKLRLIGD